MTNLTGPIDRAALTKEHTPRTLASIVGEGGTFFFNLQITRKRLYAGLEVGPFGKWEWVTRHTGTNERIASFPDLAALERAVPIDLSTVEVTA